MNSPKCWQDVRLCKIPQSTAYHFCDCAGFTRAAKCSANCAQEDQMCDFVQIESRYKLCSYTGD